MKKNRLSISIMLIALMLSMVGCGNTSESSIGMSTNSYNSTAGAPITESYTSKSSSLSIMDAQPDMMNGLGASSSSNTSYDEYVPTENVDTVKPEISNKTTSENIYETKLIYYSNVEIETMDFDNDLANLRGLIDKYNGFIEEESFVNTGSSYLNYNRYPQGRAAVKRQIEILIRIPSKNFDAFNSENEAMGNLINKSSSVENITQNYYDTTAQVEALEARLARLQEMMNNAVEYEDLIVINQELTNVEYELNKMKTVVRTMDMDVAYSYIAVELKEVVEYSEIEEVEKDTFINRLKDTVENSLDEFGGFLEDLLFSIIMLLPYLIIIGIVVVVIRVVFKKQLKERKELKNIKKQALAEIFKPSESKNKEAENKDKAEVQAVQVNL